MQRTAAVADKVDAILKDTPGVKYYTGVVGFSLLSSVFTTYNAFYFITLDPWDERVPRNLGLRAILPEIQRRVAVLPEAQTFVFPPPAIPGVGTSGGVTFVLEDRAGKDVQFLARADARLHGGGPQAPGVLPGDDDAPAERAPGVRRRGSRQGAEAGRRA